MFEAKIFRPFSGFPAAGLSSLSRGPLREEIDAALRARWVDRGDKEGYASAMRSAAAMTFAWKSETAA